MNSFKLNHHQIYYKGPDHRQGPLPALFYFAFSAEESLSHHPYDEPVKYLSEFPLRIFSLSIPEHSLELTPLHGMARWAQKIAHGHPIITDFSSTVSHLIDKLIEKEWITPQKIAIAGLSRGAFIACHIASHSSHIHSILGFSPLTSLEQAKEFDHLKNDPLTLSLNLRNLCPLLVGKQLRFYIGNRDKRVGTSRCFQFIQELTEANFEKKLRSLPVELHIYPSTGHQGHGTPPYIFNDGALWLSKILS